MANDIFQLKPNFHGIGVDLNALWKWFRRQPPNKFEIVSNRFIELFEQHGVVVTQIPRLLPSVTLAHLASPNSLLLALTSDVLDAACLLFGIRREWLEGSNDRIYEHRHCYKAPQKFFDELGALQRASMVAPVRAFTTDRQLDYRKSGSQRLELVMVETAAWLGDDEIERYRPFSDGWDWGYQATRVELKAIVAAYGAPVPMYLVTHEEMDALYAGAIFPKALIRGALCTDPSLEDYCMPLAKNIRARETEELEMVSAIQVRKDRNGLPR